MEAPVRRLSPRARLLLRTALVLAWILGVGGAAGSCLVLKYYQGPRPAKVVAMPNASAVESASPSASAMASASVASGQSGESSASAIAPSSSPSPSVVAQSTPVVAPVPMDSTEAQVELLSDVLERYRHTRLPLTVANLLLSLALVVGAARTIMRRPFGKSWLRQVCLATALFALAEHVLSRSERAYIEERLTARATTEDDVAHVHTAIKLGYGAKAVVLFAQLALFGGLFIALGRSSVVLELAPRDPSRAPPRPGADDGDA